MALLTVIGALTPKDRLELTPSIVLSSACWAVLLHPGSTNSSGVVRVAAMALEGVMRRQHPADIEAARRQHDAEAQVEAAEHEAAQDAAHEMPPLKKRKFTPPAKREILAGGGSLAAVGREAVDVVIVNVNVCKLEGFYFDAGWSTPSCG